MYLNLCLLIMNELKCCYSFEILLSLYKKLLPVNISMFVSYKTKFNINMSMNTYKKTNVLSNFEVYSI